MFASRIFFIVKRELRELAGPLLALALLVVFMCIIVMIGIKI